MKLTKTEEQITSFKLLIHSYKEIEKQIKYQIVRFNLAIEESKHDVYVNHTLERTRRNMVNWLEDVSKDRFSLEVKLDGLENRQN